MKALLVILLCVISLFAGDNSLNLTTIHYDMGQFCRATPFIVSQVRETTFNIDLDGNYVLQKEPANSKYYTMENVIMTQNDGLRISYDMIGNGEFYHVFLDVARCKMYILDPIQCTFEVFKFNLQ